jgi:serine/threonine protein kinase
MYSGADDLAIDLLNQMLRFNPRSRLSVQQALRHRFFEEIRNPEAEVTVLSPMNFDLENSFETTENLRSSVSQAISFILLFFKKI